MSALEAHLRNHIKMHGPIDIGQFMNIALCHPEHGYYMKQDPFGSLGDFTTAPEISQMFGEVIGAWVADVWMQMGSPNPFSLVECGPGRGTLMADIMRATKNIDGFHKACLMNLIEISPALKSIQAKALQEFEPTWHQSLGAVSTSYPSIIIGNEFMDALPFRQLVKIDERWAERVVTEELVFGLRPAGPELTNFIPDDLKDAIDGKIFEISPARIMAMETIASHLNKTTGATLLFDYGHAKAGLGDTFQALRKHDFVSVLDYVGDADLTSHVDFDALIGAAEAKGMTAHAVVDQGAFLTALGIQARAQYLIDKADEQQKEEIASALNRLTAPDEMGNLFKVMGIHYGDITPAGFR